jgi:hypothetical protein
MTTKTEEPLSERVEWHDSDYGRSTGWHGVYRVELFADGRGMFTVVCQPVLDHRRFRIKGGLPAAKLEALRIVQRAVLQAADAWR